MRRGRWSPIRYGNPHKRKASREEARKQRDVDKTPAELASKDKVDNKEGRQ